MDTTPTTTTTTATSTSTAAAKNKTEDDAKDASPAITSDFQTFLTMLTTQMENQDPLNPIESTDFAVQLATFSGVEQQVRTNDLLAAIQAQLGASGMSQYAGWVGMEVQAVAAASFEGEPITIFPDPASGAERTMVVVRDASTGEDVDYFEIPVSDDPVEWDGLDGNGIPYPEGNYTFHLQSIADNVSFSEEQMEVYSEVQELRLVDGETRLILADGSEIAATDASSVRQPGGSEQAETS
ncbi:MAG: flagellar hook assembly protein FlgD [Maritimibacter sp.]|nr:flagellar hook assembly protein FlgD [Maritimibacter sp.]